MKRPLLWLEVAHYSIEGILFAIALVVFNYSDTPVSWLAGAQLGLLMTLEVLHRKQSAIWVNRHSGV